MFYLMRHAKPDYSHIKPTDRICWSYLAPLYQKSRDELQKRNFDEIKVDLIVSSPFTRALETALIVSKKINKEVVVEPLLHEWLPDIDSLEEAVYTITSNKNFKENKPGKYEPIESCRERLLTVFEKYRDRNILFVAHARLFSSVLGRELNFAEIAECQIFYL